MNKKIKHLENGDFEVEKSRKKLEVGDYIYLKNTNWVIRADEGIVHMCPELSDDERFATTKEIKEYHETKKNN